MFGVIVLLHHFTFTRLRLADIQRDSDVDLDKLEFIYLSKMASCPGSEHSLFVQHKEENPTDTFVKTCKCMRL